MKSKEWTVTILAKSKVAEPTIERIRHSGRAECQFSFIFVQRFMLVERAE